MLPEYVLAFVMMTHRRLGEHCILRNLPRDIIQSIFHDILQLQHILIMSKGITSKVFNRLARGVSRREIYRIPKLDWIYFNSSYFHTKSYLDNALRQLKFLWVHASAFCTYKSARHKSHYFILYEPHVANILYALPHVTDCLSYVQGALETALPISVRYHARLNTDKTRIQIFIFGHNVCSDAVLKSRVFIDNMAQIETKVKRRRQYACKYILGKRNEFHADSTVFLL